MPTGSLVLSGNNLCLPKKGKIMAYKYLLWAELDLLIVRFNGKKNDFTPKLLFTFHIVLFLELGCKPPEGMDFP